MKNKHLLKYISEVYAFLNESGSDPNIILRAQKLLSDFTNWQKYITTNKLDIEEIIKEIIENTKVPDSDESEDGNDTPPDIQSFVDQYVELYKEFVSVAGEYADPNKFTPEGINELIATFAKLFDDKS